MSSIGSTDLVLTPEMKKHHRTQFNELMAERLSNMDDTAGPMKVQSHQQKIDFLLELEAGKKSNPPVTKSQLKNKYPQAYDWAKTYDVIVVGTEKPMLVYSFKGVSKEGEIVGLDQCQQVLHRDNVYDNIIALHTGTEGSGKTGHPKARTFKKAVVAKYGKSVPAWATDLLCATCPVCIRQQTRKKPKAGHTPIFTPGFNSRCQIDIIDMQSMPDGPFKYILGYHCHGIKAPLLYALATKEIRAVAWILFNIFTMWGPPATLQADNGSEFGQTALSGRAKFVNIDDQVSNVFTMPM